MACEESPARHTLFEKITNFFVRYPVLLLALDVAIPYDHTVIAADGGWCAATNHAHSEYCVYLLPRREFIGYNALFISSIWFSTQLEQEHADLSRPPHSSEMQRCVALIVGNVSPSPIFKQ